MKSEETNISINDIIFENRNKSYGAYFLRKLYGNNVTIALLIGVTTFSVALTAPIIYKKFFAEDKQEEKLELVEVQLEDVNIKQPDLPPPPPMPISAPPPKIDMVKFIPPEVKPDEEVKDEEEPPTEDKLKDSNPGDKTQDGEKLNTVVESGTGEGTGTAAPPPPPKPVEIATWVPEMPQFPGGPAEYLQYLKKHIEYPERALESRIKGVLKISFIVNPDGTLGDIKIIKGLGFGLDEEAIRVFKKMPRWKPGKRDGAATTVRLTYPVTFEIAEE